MTKCVVCGREYLYDRKKGHCTTKCNSCVVNTRKDAIKIRAVIYKGGCCELCGYANCLKALEFHHIDPSKKIFSISGSHCRKWESIRAELDKCQLLCSNCHKESHCST